jgi:hypothetical protein
LNAVKWDEAVVRRPQANDGFRPERSLAELPTFLLANE